MSVQEKKALAHRVFDEIWSQGKLDLTEQILSPDFVGRPGGIGEPFRGTEGAKRFVGRLREGFPDIRFVVDDMVAEDDLVATRWMSVGTHEGEFLGLEPTGRQATFGGMTFLRFENGAIVEGWTQIDALTLLRALGAVHEPARA